ncbi:unnamed protein product [Urochloa humidicola]
MDLLPEELLADILRRLAPRPLAVCRSVSKDLRAAIDGRGLLLALGHRVPTAFAASSSTTSIRTAHTSSPGRSAWRHASKPCSASFPATDGERS